MSHPIPPEAQRLADRLRLLAVEIESAARYGIPIPSGVSVSSYENVPAVHLSLSCEEFDAWADYCDVSSSEEYDHEGSHWWRAEADINGLRVSFAATGVPILTNAAVSA